MFSILDISFLKSTYFPPKDNAPLLGDDAVFELRNSFGKVRKNLNYFYSQRFGWINDYLSEKKEIVEIGSGPGLSVFYLNYKPILTDVKLYPWTDLVLDATSFNFDDNSLDIIIAMDTIHHLSSPMLFFHECQRVLKRGGYVLISDINASLYTRIGLRMLKLEGWSFDVDVYDIEAKINDPNEPWGGNNAVSRLLFDDPKKFADAFPGLEVERIENKFFTIHALSGGAMVNFKMPSLPTAILNLLMRVDDVLTKLAPNLFAANKRIAIRKR